MLGAGDSWHFRLSNGISERNSKNLRFRAFWKKNRVTDGGLGLAQIRSRVLVIGRLEGNNSRDIDYFYGIGEGNLIREIRDCRRLKNWAGYRRYRKLRAFISFTKKLKPWIAKPRDGIESYHFKSVCGCSMLSKVFINFPEIASETPWNYVVMQSEKN